MKKQINLPPGQRAIDSFPRFGLPKYARRFQEKPAHLQLRIAGDVQNQIILSSEELNSLRRIERASDFHCVTTWTKQALLWGGFRFIDFYETIIQTKVQPAADAKLVIFRSQDGFRASLPLADLLADDVLLADTLGQAPLSAKHGAPLRLVAPAHYGYKHVKHLKAIEFWQDDRTFRPPAFRFMNHPRARVAFEERGKGIPGWLLRLLYRPLVQVIIRHFERSMG